jgi:hypothetical protein
VIVILREVLFLPTLITIHPFNFRVPAAPINAYRSTTIVAAVESGSEVTAFEAESGRLVSTIINLVFIVTDARGEEAGEFSLPGVLFANDKTRKYWTSL